MKNRFFSIATFLFITLIVSLSLYSNLVNGKARGRAADGADDLEKLEDSIIIKGLEMNSDTPPEDEEMDFTEGNIIYDDAFDDAMKSVGQPDKDAGTGRGYPGKKDTVDPESILKDLQKKDGRWHLTSHKIKKGENLWVISRRYRTDYRLVIQVNRINHPERLNEGNSVLVPNRKGVTYNTRRGDTLNRISRKFGISGSRIIAHNNIRRSPIKPGQNLFIPDALPVADKPEHLSPRRKDAPVIISPGRNLAARIFQWPYRGNITSGFGKRRDPLSHKRSFHCGMDISANQGTPVKAAAAGKVIFSGWKDGYGNVVILRHDGGFISVYAHNKHNLVMEEDEVTAGDIVALSGMTGAVTGAHIHFEIRKYLTPLNPMRFLR